MSRWFRMYAEVLEDPKVQRLSGDDFKAWVNLLCLAARGDGVLPSVEDVSFALRLDPKKTAVIIGRLVSAGLIETADGAQRPHNWNARQYKSDVSTGRVKRFRERSKGAPETSGETPPETETETEVPLAKANGAEVDPDKAFWDSAKAYLGKAKASKIGQWVRDHGREQTASAIAAAQVERAVDPVSFVEGRFRAIKRLHEPAFDGPLC